MNVRDVVPTPHVLVHVLHSSQLPSQSSGHAIGVGEQSRVSVESFVRGLLLPPQTAPPYAASDVIVKLRTCSPISPQVSLHSLHSPQLPSQSSGHSWVLQLWLLSSAPLASGHGSPPKMASTVILNVRTWLPPPHDRLHSALQEPQPPTQSTGQSTSVLQLFTSVSPAPTSHTSPPYAAGCDTANDRATSPSPHVVLHEPHDDHSPTQSTGHSCALQVCCLSAPSLAGHVAPPYSASCVTWYVLNCNPEPQVNEHSDHSSSQSPSQSTGQSCVLQTCVDVSSSSFAHSTPPKAASVSTTNVRVSKPPPQLTLQAFDHEPHSPTQSTGQSTLVLHDSEPLSPAVYAHCSPPCAAARDTPNVRWRVPSAPQL